MKKIYLKLAIALALIASLAVAQRTLIHCGTLIDGIRPDAQRETTVVVEADKITAVQRGYTDAGVFIHGNNAKEFEYTVEAEMPPIEALMSALMTSAKLLGMDT